MALSVPPHQIWDRTLPNPASLLPNGIDPRRSSSLLQHHISSSQFMTPAADEGGRRNTVPHLPRPGHGICTLTDEVLKHRQDSAMSMQSCTESSPESTSPTDNPSDLCLCIPSPKIPRPRNAFILYRQNQHAAVVAQHPGLPNPDISKIIGEQWRQLAPEEKSEWQALAEQEKARHSQQFPDYRYRPKRNGKCQQGEPNPVNHPSNCTKCGGKTMNPPHTPHYPAYDPRHGSVVSVARPAKRQYTEAHVQPPRPSIAQVAPHPHAGPVRYAFGSGPPRHDSIHYVRGPPPPPAHYIAVEGPEAKRRRMEGGYAPQRPSYDPYFERDRAPVPYHPEHGVRQGMLPPSRSSHAAAPQIGTPTRANFAVQNRRDPSLTLPPLKTAASPRPVGSPNSQTQKSGIEAMIMSYPILTKLKTLHSITPVLNNTYHGSQPARGAIIAIEGLEQKRVLDMTASLADQLEKEGKFAVRIFTGPDPYLALHSSRRTSVGRSEHDMTTEKYLHLISSWHKVSKEVHDFVNNSTNTNNSSDDHVMLDASANSEAKPKTGFDRSPTRVSPISAVSPKTQVQNDKMQVDPSAPNEPSKESDPSHVRITRSRVPTLPRPIDTDTANKPLSSSSPEPSSSTPALAPSLIPPEKAQHPQTPHTVSEHPSTPSPTLLPVALIPHYQLTTVDTSSIALPISDNYDPLTHWRWHATLWRGCVGPDISVVIQSAHETHDDEQPQQQQQTSLGEGKKSNSEVGETLGQVGLVHRRAGSGGPAGPTKEGGVPGSAVSNVAATGMTAAPFGVEVRLADHRAVIVRTGAGDREGEKEKENENWEKAKRRVGFEVEESLRR